MLLSTVSAILLFYVVLPDRKVLVDQEPLNLPPPPPEGTKDTEETGARWPASRHRIASVFASWERIAEDFRSENVHRQDFCVASQNAYFSWDSVENYV